MTLRAITLSRPSLPLPLLTAAIALWLSLVCNVPFYQKISLLSAYQGADAWLFVAASAALLWAYFNLVFQWLAWGPIAKPLLSVLLLCSALCTYFIQSYGVGIDAGQITNMMETDVHEVQDLLSWQMLGYLVGLGLLPIAVMLLLRTSAQPARAAIKMRLLASTMSLVIAGLVAFFYAADYAYIFREHREVRHWVVPHNYLAGLKRYYKVNSDIGKQPLLTYGTDAIRSQPTGTPRLWVMVLGETARAQSFSLNGYARNTNPELAQLDIQYAANVSSCGTATAVSLPCLFSGMTRRDYDAGLASHREGLLDILQRAGYAVTWIDNNSGCKGACDRVNTWSIPDDIKKDFCDGKDCVDGMLIPGLQRYLSEQPVRDRVIVLHQQGSHGPAYYKRYPDAFKRFTPTCDSNALQSCSQQQIINTYDNTIAYTDHVLASLVRLLDKQTPYQASLLYVSDHGESTGEHGLYLHGAPYMLAPDQQTQVPLLTWYDDTWKNKPSSDCLAAKMRTLSHDNVFHTVLGWLEVKTRVYNPELDWQRHC